MEMELTLNNSVRMPALGFGVFQTPPDQTVAAVEAALATGYRHIDTAAAYGNEREVGEGVRRSGVERSDVFIETKVWVSDYGYDQTRHAWEKATAKLGVNYLNLHPAPTSPRSLRENHRRVQRAGVPARRRACAGDWRQ
jgi:2,5-diketo-D-gluconate reductase A